MGWTIRLCGPMGVDHDGRSLVADLPGRQGRLLFAYLVLNRDRDCGRGELIDLLWPERPPAAADTALSALLSKLRRALGEGALAGRSELRLVPPGDIEVDVEHAAATAAHAELSIDAHDWPEAAAASREVLTVDLQTFLPDCEGPWVNEAGASWRPCACARSRCWRSPACARAAASWAPPSRRRGPRSPPRRSASPRTGC